METTLLILQVLIFGISIFAYFLIKNLLPSYFSEKGRNLATKEDIEEITTKIKTIETKIKIKESGEIDYNSLKRKVIIEYFTALNNWQRIIGESEASDDRDNEVKNDIKLSKIKEAKLNYNLKEGEIELFIDDEEFYDVRQILTINILELQHLFEIYCFEIKKHFKIIPTLLKYSHS